MSDMALCGTLSHCACSLHSVYVRKQQLSDVVHLTYTPLYNVQAARQSLPIYADLCGYTCRFTQSMLYLGQLP